MKFVKKPIVIEAVQFTKEMSEGKENLPEGVVFDVLSKNAEGYHEEYINAGKLKRHFIKTLEGKMYVQIGDWIITGVKGERYPCKPDIFEATYNLKSTYSEFESAQWTIDVDEDETGKPFWRGAGAGDKEESRFDFGEPLIMDPNHFPPGTYIVVFEPDTKDAEKFYEKLYSHKDEVKS